MNKNKTKPLKITVIGGSGFVGTNLCKALEKSIHEFEIIDLKISKKFPNKCKIGDIRDLNSLRNTISGEVVVNLAAVHRDDIRDRCEYQITNVNGAKNLTIVCKEKNIQKIIFTSTVAVYGFADPGTDETGKINPFNEYGRTKFEAEEKLRLWQLERGNSLFIVRPTVIFGERNRGNVFNLLAQIKSGRFLMIGKGKNKKSMAYVENVVAFIKDRLLTRKIGLETYNYIDKPDFTMNELTLLVQKIVGVNIIGIKIPYIIGLVFGYAFDLLAFILKRKLPISSVRVKKFCATTQFDASKAHTSFTAPYSLEDGLNRTLEYEFINKEKDDILFYSE